MGRFSRLRPEDAALQDQIFAEAHRLYESKTPLTEPITRLIEIAGDNPQAFGGIAKKNTKGLNRTPEGRAVLRLVVTAQAQRDHTRRTGVPLPWGRHSSEEKSLAAMPIADAFDLLSKEEPKLLELEVRARQLAVDHREDEDGGAALHEALGQLFSGFISDRLVGRKSDKRTIMATNVAAMVVVEQLAASAGVDTSPSTNAASLSWWPGGD